MRNINSLHHDQSMSYIVEIINAKKDPRKTRLSSLRVKIEHACDEYFNNRGSLQILSENPDLRLQKEDLLHCYNSHTKPFLGLRKDILLLSNYCPYCNLDKSTTLDHYLPKETFPEFSTYGGNLIPCCDVCNVTKGEHWRTSTNERMFLNVYFDGIPDEQFLFIELAIETGTIYGKFFIERPETLQDDALWEICLRHVDNFNLKERYQDDLNILITEDLKNAISVQPGISIEDIKKHLFWDINSKMSLGNNYWKTVVRREIIERDDILEYLRTTG